MSEVGSQSPEGGSAAPLGDGNQSLGFADFFWHRAAERSIHLAALAKVRDPSLRPCSGQAVGSGWQTSEKRANCATKFGSLVRRRLPYDAAIDGGIVGDW